MGSLGLQLADGRWWDLPASISGGSVRYTFPSLPVSTYTRLLVLLLSGRTNPSVTDTGLQIPAQDPTAGDRGAAHAQ